MIIDINKNTLGKVKNVYLLFHMLPGLMMTEDFRTVVEKTGIQIDEGTYEGAANERVEALRRSGAIFRNAGKSVYINRISPACAVCDRGEGAVTVDISHSCNRRCYHCFGDTSKIPKNQLYDYIARIDLFNSLHEVKSFGLSGGEPLLFKTHALDCLAYVGESSPGAYKRLYTNGDFVDADILEELRGVGLDEIRFSIKHEDFDDWTGLKNKMLAAKDRIPTVMVEMPVMPGTRTEMQDILLQLDKLEIFGINLCEFCYCMHHANDFNKRNYKVKFPPFKMMYLGSNQYPGIPVAGSELESYELLQFAIDRGLKLGVHYCSLENRLTSPIYDLNHDKVDNPQIDHFSQRDYFIKNALVCGERDVMRVLGVFKKQQIKDYRIIDGSPRCVQFHVDKIDLLKEEEDLEIGVVSSVMENEMPSHIRTQEEYVKAMKAGHFNKIRRTVKIDLTYPGIFDFVADV